MSREAGLQLRLLGLSVRQELDQRRTEHTRQHIRGEIFDVAHDDAQAIGSRLVVLGRSCRDPRHLTLKFLCEDARVIFGHQMILKDGESRGFERSLADRHPVRAGAALLLAGTAIIILTGDRIGRAAAAAPDKARQQVLLAILPADRHLCVRTLSALELVLNCGPLQATDDADVRQFYFDPFAPVPEPVPPFPLLAVGITAPLPSTPDQSPDIERVVEDPRRFLRVPADGRGVPLSAARTRDAIGVEAGGDLDGRGACGELGEDALDDKGLPVIDLKEPADEFTPSVELDNAFVAIGPAACESSGEHRCLHTAHRLVDQMLKKDRAEQACDRDFDLVDIALGNRVQRDPVTHAQERHILGIAGEPIERLADDQVHGASLDVAQQSFF